MKKKENKKKYGYIKIEMPDYPEIKKVYCINCKYYKPNEQVFNSELGTWSRMDLCFAEGLPTTDTYKCQIVENSPQILNKDNDCKWYEKYEEKKQEDSN